MADGRHVGIHIFAIIPQWFVRFARNFVRRCEICPQWRLNAKNFEFW